MSASCSGYINELHLNESCVLVAVETCMSCNGDMNMLHMNESCLLVAVDI